MAMISERDSFESTFQRKRARVEDRVRLQRYLTRYDMTNFQSKSTNLLPPLPEGKAPPPGITIPNAISQTLQAYPPQQLTDIISQLKAVATNNPEQGSFFN